MVIRDLKLKSIYRAQLIDFEDGFVIQKGPAGDKADKILSDALRKLKASGKLQELYSKIHKPYDDWQPSQMNW